jgi:protein gp37
MSSKIEWLNGLRGHTSEQWSPVTGCDGDLPCRERCWAARMCERFCAQWDVPIPPNHFTPTFHPRWLDRPLHWKEPRMVFCCGMGDLFSRGVPNQWIADILDVICDARCQQHIFVLLTKRPECWEYFNNWAEAMLGGNHPLSATMEACGQIPNLWIGTSAATQAELDERLPALLDIPGAVHGSPPRAWGQHVGH